MLRNAEFEAELSGLAPGAIEAYLRAHDWDLQGEGAKGSLWTKGGEGGLRLILPASKEFADYAPRVLALIESVARIEGRSAKQVVQEMQFLDSDVIKIGVEFDAVRYGSVPLDHVVDMIGSAKKLMSAAASATLDKRHHFPTNVKQAVKDYLQSLRLGQTEQGSFVIALISKIDIRRTVPDGEVELVDVPSVFGRKVLATLSEACSATVKAAEETETDFTPFFEAYEDGVSANLCDAIVGIAPKQSENGVVSVRFSWAGTHEPPAVANEVTIPTDYVPKIREAAHKLRAIAPIDQFRVAGRVVAARQNKSGEMGTITVDALVDDATRKVKIRLQPGPYGEAVRAHLQDRQIECYGQLVREQNYAELLRPYGLRVLAADDL